MKSRRPIFTTHDGHKLFVGDKCFWLNTDNWAISKCSYAENPNPDVKFVYFKDRQKAEEYIAEHKPLFSRAMIAGVYDNLIRISLSKYELIEKLNQLLKKQEK